MSATDARLRRTAVGERYARLAQIRALYAACSPEGFNPDALRANPLARHLFRTESPA